MHSKNTIPTDAGRRLLLYCRKFFGGREHMYLLAILVFGVLLSLLLFKGPSFYGDDSAYLAYVPSVLSGTFAESINIFSLRLLMDIPLAGSVALFGYTNLSAGLWALVAYAATIAIVYLVGKEIYDGRAGLLAALLFSIYPLSLHFNTSPDPMLPMVLFASLSLLFFIYGRKKRSIADYTLSGIFAFMGTLANPLAYLYFLFYAFFIIASAIYDSAKKRRLSIDFRAFGIFLGLLTAIAVLGYINMIIAPSGSPFYGLSQTNNYYSHAGGPDEIFYTNPSLTFYISGYFPYNFSGVVLLPLLHLNLQSAAAGISGIWAQMFSLAAVNTNDVGLFGYAMVVAGLYLLFKRDKCSYFVLLVASFLVAYMEFGSMSITHYFPIYKLMRFTAIVAVPLMLVLGISLSSFMSGPKGKKRVGATRGIIVAAIVVLLFSSSITMDYYYHILNHNSMEFVAFMANALKPANLQGANIFAPGEISYYLPYYLGYPANANINQYDNGAYGGLFFPTCGSIPNNTYLVIPPPSALLQINSYNLWSVNESWAFDPQECNFTLYADIYNNPALRSLSIYDPTYAGNIYYKR